MSICIYIYVLCIYSIYIHKILWARGQNCVSPVNTKKDK